MVLVVKKTPGNAAYKIDASWTPGSERSPRRGHGSPLEYYCLENPMDRGAWKAIVCRVAKIQTQLKQLRVNVCMPFSVLFNPISIIIPCFVSIQCNINMLF